MNLLLSGKYIFSKAPWLNWEEVLYGLDHGYVDCSEVSSYACESLTKNSSTNEYELASLGCDGFSNVRDLLKTLTGNELDSENLSGAWAYLLLSWIFDNKENYCDPFELVDMVCAEFNYPDELLSLIRYMPLQEGGEGSEEYLMSNWARYLFEYSEGRKSFCKKK